MAKCWRIACFMVVLALVMVEQGEAVTCSDLGPSIAQCGPFARGAMSQPSAGCCSAVKAVYARAQTAQDRRTLCSCLKQSASSVPGVQGSSVAAIPQRCGLQVSISTNPNVDCATIN
ncbi:AAI domain-containing protein [Heracleum sosnowskyi]|uniref:Non-specific lipid-transfer protein n=1 Tax=Heracleum sosnowskyi TaxID=360622 RepID=A0AAD8IWI1_9APIA|nr:AAI domain-containing protein [Heracleum sosnowskyi]